MNDLFIFMRIHIIDVFIALFIHTNFIEKRVKF